MTPSLALITSQFTLGNLFILIAITVAAVGGYYRLRGLRRAELEETSNFWREQVEPLKTIVDEQRLRADDLARQRDEQRRLKHGLRAELDAERKTRDLAPIVKALVDQSAALAKFEASISERVEASVHAQKETSEILQGLVSNVADLNRTIRQR